VTEKEDLQREWDEHDRDHERERQVARETAHRLERELKDTAKRLEDAVKTALAGHERIHQVEKIQVDKAEEAMNERLARMNEFRAALQDAASRMVTRETFDAAFKSLQDVTSTAGEYAKKDDLTTRIQPLTDRIILLEKNQVSDAAMESLREKIATAERTRVEDSNRQRTTLRNVVIGAALGVGLNFIINIIQGGTAP
jgi:hypothetical protein